MENYILEMIIGGLGAMAMLFGKMQLDTMKDSITKQTEEIAHIKDAYYKKEDFKEFKQELWGRLDKMESSVEAKIERIKGYRITDFPERG
jgi:hypothetical protein